MDQAPQPEDAAESAREERRADVQRRIDEVAGVLAETLLGMWRAKYRAERRGEPWPPPEPPKPEPRSSVLSDRPKALRRTFRELAPGDEAVVNVLLQATWGSRCWSCGCAQPGSSVTKQTGTLGNSPAREKRRPTARKHKLG